MKKRSLYIIRDEHASLAAMLHAMTQLVERGPLEDAQKFFEVMRAMLFYIDEFPEQLHHPKESNLLFPKVVKRAPEVMGAIDRLERDHMHLEESIILPAAELALHDEDWTALDAAFEQNADPLTGKHVPRPEFEKLFSRIVSNAPAPIGLG